MTEVSQKKGYVKKETLYFAIIIVFVTGYIAGVTTAIYKMKGSDNQGQSSGTQQQVSGGAPADTGMASRILHLEDDLKNSPDNAEILVELGNLYFDTNNPKKSIINYEKALKLIDDPNVWTDLGVMYRRVGNPHKAIESFQKAYTIKPTHEMSRLNEGIVKYYDLEDKEGAIKAWKELLKVNPLSVTGDGTPIDDMINQLSE